MNPKIEIIGIIATIFVLIGFMRKDAKYIRAINIIGAILFVIYGFLIESLSTWILNGLLIIIHTIFLIKDFTKKK